MWKEKNLLATRNLQFKKGFVVVIHPLEQLRHFCERLPHLITLRCDYKWSNEIVCDVFCLPAAHH